MATITTILEDRPLRAAGVAVTRAVSWQAILAGAVAAAALSLILFMLGIGLGLSALSPWTDAAPSADAISLGAILWIAFVALASSGLGGYIAGRLRESWPGVQADEVYFRDTAHGFLAWAVATLLTAVALASAIGAMAKTAAPVAAAAGAAAGTSAASPGAADQWNYAVDSLFRQSSATPPATGAPSPIASPALDDTRARTEVGGIFTAAGPAGALSPEDARHVGQMLAQHRGYPQAEAEQRVVDTFNAELSRREKMQQTARQAAEEARRNAARASLWLFVASLLGAFFASLMATFGGRQRDLP